MTQPNVLILRAPGTNCDRETMFAFEKAGAKAERLHVNRVLEDPAVIERFQILCLPGGFSYGDDVAAGRILGNQIQHHLADTMTAFKDAGKLILGICNGFQILIKSGVLLEPDADEGLPATLTWNDSGRFEDRWVELGVEGDKCVFLRGIQRMYLPVAHAEGKFVTRSAQVLDRLDTAGQLVLRYRRLPGGTAGGNGSVPFPDNPNGSMGDVAGVCDSTGRVLGLMPHPERHVDPTHHPRWTRSETDATSDGLAVFTNAVAYFD
ncbi:MAG: phosphoribosylformylglycinamidine synthase I [Pirellulales bacterium]|nr:phosphoribosylformylglycinamidine synthase I [Pirellulales bacterium]